MLDEVKHEYYKVQLPEETMLKVFLQGISLILKIKEVKQNWVDTGFEVLASSKIIAIILFQLGKTDHNNNILNLTKLCHMLVTVEPQRTRITLTQSH